jgi:SAM-dependent methyltransferase
MPSVSENVQNWSDDWDWSRRGDEWSVWWGGTPALWYGALLPRIHALVPTGTILELAPGFGRWTQFLKDLCQQLTIVDLTEACIEHCQERFAGDTNITYHVNDGRSLAMVEDRSIDFCFSFDSLVHAEPDVLRTYLEQLATKLRPDGVGFIHHSNAGALRPFSTLSKRLPARLFPRLMRAGLAVNLGAWRDERMSAALFRQQCEQAGLACISQELVSWEYGRYLLDSLSLFTPQGSKWARPTRVVRNPMFVAEARRMARLYSDTSLNSAK